jgi:hypothetical protein
VTSGAIIWDAKLPYKQNPPLYLPLTKEEKVKKRDLKKDEILPLIKGGIFDWGI